MSNHFFLLYLYSVSCLICYAHSDFCNPSTWFISCLIILIVSIYTIIHFESQRGQKYVRVCRALNALMCTLWLMVYKSKGSGYNSSSAKVKHFQDPWISVGVVWDFAWGAEYVGVMLTPKLVESHICNYHQLKMPRDYSMPCAIPLNHIYSKSINIKFLITRVPLSI